MPPSSCPLVSVIIPLKNGMPVFARVIEAVLNQKTTFEFEVIVIDSGSTDGSLEVLDRNDDRIKLIRIEPSEFGHGKTRNLGAEISAGAFCAYLTHDALPADANWLSNLVAPLIRDDRVAGVFGRHISYPNASPFTQWELARLFKDLSANPILEITDAHRYASDEGWRKVCHFYSDNSSCLRKSVWEEINYPEVSFAEDQLWAKTIIEAGYRKAYADDSVVYHSHNYSLWERVQRSYEEARAMLELFGYPYIQSKRQAVRTWAYICAQDMKRGFTKGWIIFHPWAMFMRPLDNAAKVIGLYLGTKNPKFVDNNASFFSKDEKLWLKGQGKPVSFKIKE